MCMADLRGRFKSSVLPHGIAAMKWYGNAVLALPNNTYENTSES